MGESSNWSVLSSLRGAHVDSCTPPRLRRKIGAQSKAAIDYVGGGQQGNPESDGLSNIPLEEAETEGESRPARG
jgi:hypothetical protein